MATRCFCPPDSWSIFLFPNPGSPTRSRMSATFLVDVGLFFLAPLETEGDVLGHVHHGKKGQVLKDQVHRPAVGRTAGHVAAADQNAPPGGLDEAGDHSQQRGFPAARRTQDGKKRPFSTAKETSLTAVKSPNVLVTFSTDRSSDHIDRISVVKSLLTNHLFRHAAWLRLFQHRNNGI
jgi:hypothetical protein